MQINKIKRLKEKRINYFPILMAWKSDINSLNTKVHINNSKSQGNKQA